MKFNWGFGIALFYATFMVVLLYFVVKSTTHDNSLVFDNYYEQDLKYQSHFDRVVNTQKLKQQVAFKQNIDKQTIDVSFPKGMKKLSGSVHMFRPSTKKIDFFQEVKVDETGLMSIHTRNLKSGRWKIKINWQDSQKEYYTEKDIEL